MLITGDIKYRKSVLLDEKRIRELNDLLLNYCDRVDFAGDTVAGANISFANITELCSYDNFKKRKLQRLCIYGYNGYDRKITVRFTASRKYFALVGYHTIAICSYEVDSTKAETEIRTDFNEYLDKCKASYWLLGKFTTWGAICIPSWCISFIRLMTGQYKNITPVSLPILIASIAICCGAFYLSYLIDKYLLDNLFPSVSFSIGEEKQRYEKWRKLRQNILWGIIMALIIGCAGAYLYDTLKGLL